MRILCVVLLLAVPVFGVETSKDELLAQIQLLKSENRRLREEMTALKIGAQKPPTDLPDALKAMGFKSVKQLVEFITFQEADRAKLERAVVHGAPSERTGGDGLNLDAFLDCQIKAGDGAFLGIISVDKYDEKSINNSYGKYGGKYEEQSIFYNYGKYGDRYSNTSAFCPYASNPPRIVTKDGKLVAYLTVGKLKPAIDPGVLKALIDAKSRN